LSLISTYKEFYTVFKADSFKTAEVGWSYSKANGQATPQAPIPSLQSYLKRLMLVK
jgi:hypothetical protein